MSSGDIGRGEDVSCKLEKIEQQLGCEVRLSQSKMAAGVGVPNYPARRGIDQLVL